jgi:hypothetical protein
MAPELIAAQPTFKSLQQMRRIFGPSASAGGRPSTSFGRTTAEMQIKLVDNYCPSIARKLDFGQNPASLTTPGLSVYLSHSVDGAAGMSASEVGSLSGRVQALVATAARGKKWSHTLIATGMASATMMPM